MERSAQLLSTTNSKSIPLDKLDLPEQSSFGKDKVRNCSCVCYVSRYSGYFSSFACCSASTANWHTVVPKRLIWWQRGNTCNPKAGLDCCAKCIGAAQTDGDTSPVNRRLIAPYATECLFQEQEHLPSGPYAVMFARDPHNFQCPFQEQLSTTTPSPFQKGGHQFAGALPPSTSGHGVKTSTASDSVPSAAAVNGNGQEVEAGKASFSSFLAAQDGQSNSCCFNVLFTHKARALHGDE